MHSLVDEYGNVIDTTYNGSGQLTEITRQGTFGGTQHTESIAYSYVASGANTGLLESVTLRRKVGAGSYATVRSVSYSYYVDADSYGSDGDLELAEVKDKDGNVIDGKYYRYYETSRPGYQHALKYVVEDAAYSRLKANYSDPATATDAQVAGFANLYFEYDSEHRVTKETVSADGCSTCSGGFGTYTFSYTDSSNSDGYNSWKRKTVETLPDNNQNIVYMNAYGQVMLKAFKETSTGREWVDYYQYDADGRLTLYANPSAVIRYYHDSPDLINDPTLPGGNAEGLFDDRGLIELTEYYETTSAGGVEGWLEAEQIKRGETGSVVTLRSQDYVLRDGDTDIYVLASQTRYRNTDGSGGQTTSYSYSWYGTTTQMQSMTVTHPTVTPAQNGPDSADEESTYFDVYGRPEWRNDADGHITYTKYDPASGGVIEQIVDVDTDLTTGEPWSNPNGEHLVTAMDVDSLGRVTKLTEPVTSRITYTVYKDADHEVRIYRGWTGSTTTGPIEIRREYRPPAGAASGQRTVYTEVLTTSDTPTSQSGIPLGTESITASKIGSLERWITNDAGQVTEHAQYFKLPIPLYSRVYAKFGTASNDSSTGNYHLTTIDYDQRGRQMRRLSPAGTITRTVFDGLGRATSSWVGTDDTPSTGYWSPTNTDGTNLVMVAERQYDYDGMVTAT
ncbi:hypothetical protein [Fontivita pretiosa]|uniref:hypothetical protein n=1 Tax=Fontivita pretiosa TaxID=2989684 RepID=UPI003D162410